MPHHPLRELGLRGLVGRGLGHELALAQDGHAMRQAQHLGQLVTDENDGEPLRHHGGERGKERLAFLWREHRGGFIENQNPGPAVQRLENLHPLSLAHRQAADEGLGLNAQAKARGHLEHARAGLNSPGAGPPQGLGAHDDVVEHAEVVSQREVLMHHANAGLQGSTRIAWGQGLTEHLDRTRIGHIVTEQDRDQRGFARAVFTEQGQHLARCERERDVVVGHQRAEPLGDAAESQDRRVCHGRGRERHACEVRQRSLARLGLAVVDLDGEFA